MRLDKHTLHKNINNGALGRAPQPIKGLYVLFLLALLVRGAFLALCFPFVEAVLVVTVHCQIVFVMTMSFYAINWTHQHTILDKANNWLKF